MRQSAAMAEYLDEQLRRAVILVAVLNLAYFWIEFATALTIGSVALLADSADFLEDASVNLLILVLSSSIFSARSCLHGIVITKGASPMPPFFRHVMMRLLTSRLSLRVL